MLRKSYYIIEMFEYRTICIPVFFYSLLMVVSIMATIDSLKIISSKYYNMLTVFIFIVVYYISYDSQSYHSPF